MDKCFYRSSRKKSLLFVLEDVIKVGERRENVEKESPHLMGET